MLVPTVLDQKTRPTVRDTWDHPHVPARRPGRPHLVSRVRGPTKQLKVAALGLQYNDKLGDQQTQIDMKECLEVKC